MKAIKAATTLLFYFCLLTLTACSAVDAYLPKNSVPVVNLPVIPEIKRQVVRPVVRKQAQPAKVIRSTVVRRAIVKPAPVKYKQNRVIVNKPIDLETEKRLQEEAKQQAIENSTVDIDPFATIPESSSATVSSTTTSATTSRKTSPAVNTLMVVHELI